MSDKKLILLTEWGEARFSPPPSLWTLRAMARAGKISPRPVKIGKAYYVHPDAQPVDPNRAPTIVERLQQQAA